MNFTYSYSMIFKVIPRCTNEPMKMTILQRSVIVRYYERVYHSYLLHFMNLY